MDELMQVLAIHNLENAELRNRPNNISNSKDPFILLNDVQFLKMFRLSNDFCIYLIKCLMPYMRPQKRISDLSIQTRVLTALKFFGSGSYQPDIAANKFIDLSQSSVSVSVKEVTEALNGPQIFNKWVCFPNSTEKLNKIRTQFYKQHQFPGVIGCIDCTHVAIVPPNTNDPEYPEHIYVNRKNYISINVQLICDADLKIINVNAKFPGSSNDAYICNQSKVQTTLRNLHAAGHNDYFLLGNDPQNMQDIPCGDSGYPLHTWLLTPFQEFNENTPESKYNDMHKRTRVKIECCNGILKSRFCCLLKHRTLHYKPTTASKIINAYVVLHNVCREYNVPEINDEEIDDIDFGMINNDYENEDRATRTVYPELFKGKQARNKIVRLLDR